MDGELSQALIYFGVLQIAGGILLFVINLIRRRGCTRAEGTVVDNTTYKYRRGTFYRAILEYRTRDGRVCRIPHEIGLAHPLPTDGSEKRTVWYDPEHPKRTHVAGKLTSRAPVPVQVFYVVPFLLIALGLAMRHGWLPSP